MQIIYEEKELEKYVNYIVETFGEKPILIDRFLNFKFLFKMFPELLRLENSMECVVRTYWSMLLIKLPGEKTKIIRNKKNIQLVILRETEEIFKNVFMF